MKPTTGTHLCGAMNEASGTVRVVMDACGWARGFRSTVGTVLRRHLAAARELHRRSAVASAARWTDRGAEHAA